MNAEDLLALRDEFTRKDVLICFNGPFSHTLIEELGTAIRTYLESEAGRGAAAADVFAVYIELSQNMRNYLARQAYPTPALSAATLVIARSGDRYLVTAGNVVAAGDAAGLAGRIDALAGADAAELRRRYKEQLRRPHEEGHGAGVGLLDVARRCRGGLRYSTSAVDAAHTFFSITATV